MFGSIFEFLFKYRPLVYQKGQFAFDVAWKTWDSWRVLLVALLIAAPVLWYYTRARGRSTPQDRIVLAAIRVLIFVVLLLCLLRPTLIVKRVVPQQSYVAVLL